MSLPILNDCLAWRKSSTKGSLKLQPPTRPWQKVLVEGNSQKTSRPPHITPAMGQGVREGEGPEADHSEDHITMATTR